MSMLIHRRMIAHAAGHDLSSPSRPDVSNSNDDATGANDSAPSHPDQFDDDEAPLDPFLQGAIPTPIDVDEDVVEGGNPVDVPNELLPEPSDISSAEQDRLGPEISDDFRFSDAESLSESEDEQGPTASFGWEELEETAETGEDDAADGPLENPLAVLEQLHPLRSDADADDDPISAGVPDLIVDDTEIPWAKERWAELPLPSAYSARQHLALVGTTLCAAGERTHLIGSRDLNPLENAPVHATVQHVLYLDSEPSRLLLLTNCGQLMLWHRARKGAEALRRIAVPSGEVISFLWQLAPGVPNILLRLDSGRMLRWDESTETLLPVVGRFKDDRWRLRALSELGEPRVALWQGPTGARLRTEVGSSAEDIPLTATLAQALQASRPLLAGYVDHVLCGVREHGLFLYGPSHPQFVAVPGCRRITALAAGHMLGKATAFVGLFSELDDRAEIVSVDLATSRSTRIAEVTIHSDDDGPADDPPERARIDSLLWDPTQSRLWVAGCFGLTCFQPPTSKAVGAIRKNSDQ